jgi:putative SOS response-associated peptidase YedK
MVPMAYFRRAFTKAQPIFKPRDGAPIAFAGIWHRCDVNVRQCR